MCYSNSPLLAPSNNQEKSPTSPFPEKVEKACCVNRQALDTQRKKYS